ncbi:hypothetical protein K8O68_10400 [Salipaludibacillus sp. CUR1]|uniref:hypothetical protein n=1 Tax=Salipaludibacillus sp. CUR1 TaxID=2820003 RepID=UPI001E2BD42C|nr:hypothetical protein [Salipaludibacillus sp. CUR1]MCE7792825.1 hypothetical protein [Salipaludibacillus sp. CUR1]
MNRPKYFYRILFFLAGVALAVFLFTVPHNLDQGFATGLMVAYIVIGGIGIEIAWNRFNNERKDTTS